MVSEDNFHITRFARLKPMEMGKTCKGVEGWMNLKGGVKVRTLTTCSISKLLLSESETGMECEGMCTVNRLRPNVTVTSLVQCVGNSTSDVIHKFSLIRQIVCPLQRHMQKFSRERPQLQIFTFPSTVSCP